MVVGQGGYGNLQDRSLILLSGVHAYGGTTGRKQSTTMPRASMCQQPSDVLVLSSGIFRASRLRDELQQRHE